MRISLYELVRSGSIKSMRIGRQLRISKIELLRFIEDDHDPNPYKY